VHVVVHEAVDGRVLEIGEDRRVERRNPEVVQVAAGVIFSSDIQ